MVTSSGRKDLESNALAALLVTSVALFLLLEIHGFRDCLQD